MATEKISAMPSAATLDGTELVPIVQAGDNKKMTLDALVSWIFRNVAEGEICINFSGQIQGDALIVRRSGGALQADALDFSGGGLNQLTTGLNVDPAGNLLAPTLHAVDGFSGSGVFTTFTVVDGIIKAAS